MKTSKLMSVAFIAVGLFIVVSIVYYFSERSRIMAEYDRPIYSDLSEIDWSSPETITEFYVNNHNENDGSLRFVETVDQDQAVIFEPDDDLSTVIDYPLDDDIVSFMDEQASEEYCCPEEPQRDVRAEFIKKHGETSEVFEYLSLSDKQRDRIILTAEESYRFFELLAKFTPTPENLKAWEFAQKFFSEAVPGSYSMSYGD